MEFQHYDQKQPKHTYLSICLVALCPGLNAVDIGGWLFNLIKIPPLPLQLYFKYLKTFSILQQLITVPIKLMINRACKTKV